MRLAFLLLPALAACSNQPKASEAELDDFVPPTVRVRAEVEPIAKARFARLDRDADGALVAADFPRNGAARLARLDGNGDGRITREEFVAAALKRFDARDKDADGQVTSQESDAANAN